MILKELKKGEDFKPDLGPYKGLWEPPTWRKIEYIAKKKAWLCEEVNGKRIAYFNTNEKIYKV